MLRVLLRQRKHLQQILQKSLNQFQKFCKQNECFVPSAKNFKVQACSCTTVAWRPRAQQASCRIARPIVFGPPTPGFQPAHPTRTCSGRRQPPARVLGRLGPGAPAFLRTCSGCRGPRESPRIICTRASSISRYACFFIIFGQVRTATLSVVAYLHIYISTLLRFYRSTCDVSTYLHIYM